MNRSVFLNELGEMKIKCRLRSFCTTSNSNLTRARKLQTTLFPEERNGATYLGKRKDPFICRNNRFGFNEIGYIPLIIDTTGIEASTGSTTGKTTYKGHDTGS